MCGICGYINIGGTRQDSSVLKRMVASMHHRGPDSQGYYEDLEHQVFLGHARLSIIDISENGSQPMFLENLTIVLNGEIYNYREIKNELISKGHTFKSNSDTEVVLHSYKEWGESCVNRFLGMFAFAIYNSDTQTVTLFRDRAGVKPLYYYFDHNVFIFGSELKAFHENPLFQKELNYDALGLYLKYGYIPTPYCVFKNSFKLDQGHWMAFDIHNASLTVHKYWDLRSFYLAPKLTLSYEEALEETERILESAFNYRMVSDVPVGVFLSAGFDSTCVAALLQKGTKDRLRTFTIGFESGNDEAPMAKNIAAYLGTDHSEHYCSEEDALSIIKDLPFYYDEPFADSSAIPTILVSRIARQHVKVALSADAGDEVFAGYNSYVSYLRGYELLKKVPSSLRKPLGRFIHLSSMFVSEPVKKRRLKVISDGMLSNNDLAFALSSAINSNSLSHADNRAFVQNVNNIRTVYDEPIDNMTVLSRLLYSDYIQYLQDDVLVKVDRASMSTSLEGRNPLLDHRIVEYVAKLPDDFKCYNGLKKRIIKDIVYKYVPRELVDKPKTGFSVPLARWLKESLNEYVCHYLSDSELKKNDIFNVSFVNEILNNFKKQDALFAAEVWKILQLQMWYERWM